MAQTLRNKYNGKTQTFPDGVAGVLLTNTAKWETTKDLPSVTVVDSTDNVKEVKKPSKRGRKPNKK